MRRVLTSLFLVTALAGCASTDEKLDFNPNIPAAAYSSDGFPVYVSFPLHPEWKPVEFFFKGCDETGVGSHYSKTSYECTYP